MWQRLLPGYYQKQNGVRGNGGGGGGRPPCPSHSKVVKEQQQQQQPQPQQQQKQRMTLKFGRRPWRGRTHKSKPLHPRNSPSNTNHNSSMINNHNNNGNNGNSKNIHKEPDAIARLLSLERHFEKDADELLCWTEYEEDEDIWKNHNDDDDDHDDESPVPMTAMDIEQALARFDTAIQQVTGASDDMATPPVPSVVTSPTNSLQGDKNPKGWSSITVIGPNSLADHNPISALSIYTDGGNTDVANADVDNTDATINTMPSLLDNTVTTHNTMPSLVDHSVSTSTNSMPSLLDHTVTTTNTMPSLLDHTVTTFNTIPSLLDNSVTTLEYDEDQVSDFMFNGINMSTMSMDVDMMDLDMIVSTTGDAEAQAEADGEEDSIAKAVNAVLKDHHNRDFILPTTRRRESSLLVARRDSCSTISTAPDTPESPLVISEFLVGMDSPQGHFKTTTTTKNPLATVEPCHCPLPHCPRCTKTVWPLEFFFVPNAPLFPSNLPRIRKSKKFVPDPMTVGDFYGDDDEDIRFVPQAFEERDTLLSMGHVPPPPPAKNEQDKETLVVGSTLSRGVSTHMDTKKDKKQVYQDDKDSDATSTITTWTGDQEENDDDDDDGDDDEEDEMDSQVKSYSHRSGSSDIVSQMTADRTPKVKNKCNTNRRRHDLAMDEWKENLGLFRMDNDDDDGEEKERSSNTLFARHQQRTCGPQPVLAKANVGKRTTLTIPKPQRKPSDSFLAKLVRPPYATTPTPTTSSAPKSRRLFRCPSMGLEGLLPPLRHNLSLLIPPPPPPPPPPPLSSTPKTSQISGGNFQVTRIEI